LAKSKKPQISPSFELSINGDCLQQVMRKSHSQEIISFFQLVIRSIEITGDDSAYDPRRRKFGRICQRFWLSRCCGSRRFAIRIIGPSHALHHAGSEFSVVRMKEHDA
jgi:hypothetical protein